MTRLRPIDWIALAFACGIAAASANASAQWFDYNPPGSVNGRGILQEVLSRCDEQGKRTAYDASEVTYCHEATHMLNNRIRQEVGGTGKVNAFYVGGGKCIVLPEPRTTLQAVSQYVQSQFRNSTYQLYFISQQRYWNNEPLYLLDEWTAYCNGSQAARELGADPHGTYERAQWFCHYADCLVQAVMQHDPAYVALSQLQMFVAWQKQRVADLLLPPQQPAVAPQLAVLSQPTLLQRVGFAHLPLEWRQRNRSSSCVHASTVNMLRYLGLPEKANEYWSKYQGGESPGPHRQKLEACGIRYVMTTDGDDSLLEWAIANRRPVGVTWSPSHFINCMGRDEQNNAVLLGNSTLERYLRQPWQEFLAEWRRQGGWAVCILDGVPPPPSPG